LETPLLEPETSALSSGLPSLDDLLRTLVQQEGSDLHLRAGEPPVIRVHGHLQRLPLPCLTPADTEALMYSIMNPERRHRFEEDMELDMSHEIEGVARFRVNVLRQRGCVGGVLRVIPARCKTIDELALPPILKELSMLPRGLVLVTGPTGSGKSTTLASCIDHINTHRHCHVITIEDPIEFVHQDKQCAIEQRELGEDTHTFADALKHVLRQAPDVILVGEMRDLETIALAITAAETGHLVFATLHTTDAPQTIDRIIDVFPPEQQEQIRAQLAVTLQAVVAQTLLPLADRPGRIPAFEIMVATPAIRALIREAKTHQIYSMIETGSDRGMISLDQFLLGLLQKKTVALEHALAKSSNPNYLQERAARLGVTLSPASAA
jgi:twitching motility protein PilT